MELLATRALRFNEPRTNYTLFTIVIIVGLALLFREKCVKVRLSARRVS